MKQPKGITKKGDKFKVHLSIHGKKVYIGSYKSRDEAMTERDRAMREAGIEEFDYET